MRPRARTSNLHREEVGRYRAAGVSTILTISGPVPSARPVTRVATGARRSTKTSQTRIDSRPRIRMIGRAGTEPMTACVIITRSDDGLVIRVVDREMIHIVDAALLHVVLKGTC